MDKRQGLYTNRRQLKYGVQKGCLGYVPRHVGPSASKLLYVISLCGGPWARATAIENAGCATASLLGGECLD